SVGECIDNFGHTCGELPETIGKFVGGHVRGGAESLSIEHFFHLEGQRRPDSSLGVILLEEQESLSIEHFLFFIWRRGGIGNFGHAWRELPEVIAKFV